jgi:ADP-heptose:LPS heptosyltransferase
MNSIATNAQPERRGLVLMAEGLGDCLYALAVIRKLRRTFGYEFDLFTLQPGLFQACPYVKSVRSIDDPALQSYPHKFVRLFEVDKLPHWKMDTFDFISIPLAQGGLSFAEKQLEYFPVEEDRAEAFDVVLNTSVTWRTRSWPLESWQRLADALVARGLTVAVIGKDVPSKADKRVKLSLPLAGGVRNLVNALSLDQAYFTIRKARLFVSGQGGLTVLAGATDTEIVVLGMSIEWSKRAIYRRESPFYKVTYVSGACEVYCGHADDCPVPGNDFKCVPHYERVEAAVLAKLGLA